MNKTANIRYEASNMFIRTPYDADFVNELKSKIHAKRWDPEKKVWIIDIRERPKALEIIQRYYDVVEDNSPPAIPQVPESLLVESSISDLQADIRPEWLAGGNLEIWTDGACIGNPGPGGYGVVFKCNGQAKARSGGFKLTTNNRMEIMAAIVALEFLPVGSNAVIYSDSQYLVRAMMEGWAKNWKANNWKRNKKDKAINPDLWDRLLQVSEKHRVDSNGSRGMTFKRKTNGAINWRRRLPANQIFLSIKATSLKIKTLWKNSIPMMKYRNYYERD